MLGAAYGTVSDIEIFWVLIATVGIGFSAYNLTYSILDYRYWIKLDIPRNGRRDIAISTIIVEAARMGILVIFVAIGIVALTLPELPPNVDIPRNQQIAGILIRWGLIISSLLIITQSITNAIVRRRTFARIEKALLKKEGHD